MSRTSTPSGHLVRSFHVAAKPIGSRCNLDCTYCYYLPKQELLPNPAAAPMADDLLEEFIRQYIAGQDVDTLIFTWHGGEPSLLGLDFYRKVVAIQEKYAGTKRIENDLQTNGLLLDETWCEFLQEHHFLVGLSIDGPRHLHDCFRKTTTGESSFDRVCRAVSLLQRHGIPFNAMTVINAVNVREPAEVYRFLTQELGVWRIQWLPCVERKAFRTTAPGYWDQMPIQGTAAARPGHPDSIVTDWSVDPDDWGEFLCQTFDLWLQNDTGKVRISWFDSLLAQWRNQPAQICTLAEVCGRGLVLEKDGSLYSCDHFVYPEYKLGNLRDEHRQLADVVYSPEQRKFGCVKRDRLTNHCRQCSYRFACNGDCPKNRFLKTPTGEPGLSYLCSGLQRFFRHADPYLRDLAVSLGPSQGTMPESFAPAPRTASSSSQEDASR